MNKTLIFRKIGGIISELTEQYQYLAESPENINPLELELFIANSHFLAEHLAILKKLEGSPELLNQNNPVSPVTPVIPDNLVVAQDHSDGFVEPANPDKFVNPINADPVNPDIWFKPVQHQELAREEDRTPETNVEQETLIPEVLSQPAEEVQEVPPLVPENQAIDRVPDNFQLKETEAKKVETAEKVPTLNEILSEGKNRDNIAVKIGHQEERDLKSMIKLNDKLMFVRDLFGGYNLAYSEAIELVNRFDTFEAAENFLKQNYAVKNRWSEKQGTVDQFYEILNRRFS